MDVFIIHKNQYMVRKTQLPNVISARSCLDPWIKLRKED